MSATPQSRAGATETTTAPARRTWYRRLVAALLIVSGVLSYAFAGIAVYATTQLVYTPPLPITRTPADLGLGYRAITFPARVDGVRLRGWFIPGILPDGRLTSQRALIVVHGTWQNRTDPAAGLLDLTAALARHGFAVLAFDMRGMGESPPAPISFGYFEQRDVLGAVDFLRTGALPYPELGRPRAIAAYGVSMGGATVLLAAAQERAIQAVVSDSAYADILPILEREVPRRGHLPTFFMPGIVLAARVLYGINFSAVRPVDVVARVAARPLLLIHGGADEYVPTANLDELYRAAASAPGANVQEWRVAGADHAQAFHSTGAVYVARLVTFYTQALGPDTSVGTG
jgi:fermentation-respiration switch protein FrsA (DUF1100 family)